MDPSVDEAPQATDGVLVVRAVGGVSGGRQVFRVTAGVGDDEEPLSTVVAEVRALHDAVDSWLARLRSR